MKVLEIISAIWKSGANIYLDPSDNRIGITRQNLIPVEVMQAAEKNFNEIDKWFKSWKDANNEKVTMLKIFYEFSGWKLNQKLHDWLLADTESLQMFYDWTMVLGKNGWTDIYEDYRRFENDESNVMAKKIYERAVLYARKGA
ncbi:hypothetical protein FKQ51_17690 [Bacillus toyonensis]|uniref:hypothetical protein n=1 Tax=Bacillus toyonensis TaxID=155322 RepID=UPI0027042658|nr:hypothetical protein [Bacillus toyonensis]MDO8159157.1 hypothetical protein [Bacillus toyonensis]